MMFSIIMFLITVAGISMAIMDKLQFHYLRSDFSLLMNQQFWNPQLSWLNKYKIVDNERVPRFFLSTSWLVGFTDGWHLFKMIFHVTFIAGFVLVGFQAKDWQHLIGFTALARVHYGLIFTLYFKYILEK